MRSRYMQYESWESHSENKFCGKSNMAIDFSSSVVEIRTYFYDETCLWGNAETWASGSVTLSPVIAYGIVAMWSNLSAASYISCGVWVLLRAHNRDAQKTLAACRGACSVLNTSIL